MNPYTSNPSLITELVNIFFKHVPETAYCMFPERIFTAWILSPTEKSLDDLMLIYTILALSTVFSPRPEHKTLGIQYSAVSRYACDNRQFSIQLTQSRLILALYYFAINNRNDAYDFCGSALRAASGIKLNLEIDKSSDAFLKTFPFGLTRAGYAECRRRTFWSCYLMDGFNGFFSGHLSFIQPEDVFLRLPCDTRSFEAQHDVQNPFFDASTPLDPNTNWAIGSMGHLIEVSTILGDVMSRIYRSSQRPIPINSSATFKAFHGRASHRLQEWRNTLPAQYRFSPDNLDRSIETGKVGAFMTMHTVYHITGMILNRYIHKSTLGALDIEAYSKTAKQHAECVLVMMEDLARNSNQLFSPAAKFSSPFTGYAIVSAVDIYTAKFKLEEVSTCLTSVTGAQAVLSELAQYWQGAKGQQIVLQRRVIDLTDLVNQRGSPDLVRNGKAEGELEMKEPMERIFDRSYDILYG
jgi:hypothetical protein